MMKHFVFLTFMCISTIVLGQSITEKLLIKRALEKSNTVVIQENKASSVKLDRQKAYLSYMPNIYLDATYTHLNDNISFNVPAIQIPVGPGQVLEKKLDPIVLQKQNSFKSNINATVLLFSGMKIHWMAAAALHKHHSELHMVKKEESEVIIETFDFHDKLAVADQSLAVLKESKKRLDRQQEFAEKAYQNQLISAYDLNKIKIARQEIKAKEIEIVGQKKIILAKLHQLTAIDSDTLESLEPKLMVWLNDFSNVSIDDRPEIKALEEGIMATKYLAKAELSDYLPKIFAFGKRELYENDLSALDPPWYVGVGLKWHLFDGFQNKMDMQKAQLETEMIERKSSEAKSLFELNLRHTLENLAVAEELIKLSEERLKQASEGLHIVEREYEVGLAGITELLGSESDYQKAQLELIRSIYAYRQNYLKVLEATGSLHQESINKLIEN